MTATSTHELVYLGRRVSGWKKPVQLWWDLTDDKEVPFGKLKGSYVGQVVRFEHDAEAGTWAQGDHLRSCDDPRMPAWQAEARADEAEQQARRRLASDKDDFDAMADLTLAEVKAELRKRFGPNRAGYLAAVLAYVS